MGLSWPEEPGQGRVAVWLLQGQNPNPAEGVILTSGVLSAPPHKGCWAVVPGGTQLSLLKRDLATAV